MPSANRLTEIISAFLDQKRGFMERGLRPQRTDMHPARKMYRNCLLRTEKQEVQLSLSSTGLRYFLHHHQMPLSAPRTLTLPASWMNTKIPLPHSDLLKRVSNGSGLCHRPGKPAGGERKVSGLFPSGVRGQGTTHYIKKTTRNGDSPSWAVRIGHWKVKQMSKFTINRVFLFQKMFGIAQSRVDIQTIYTTVGHNSHLFWMACAVKYSDDPPDAIL